MTDFTAFFPVWDKLNPEQQQRLAEVVTRREFSKGTVIHNGSDDCAGLFLVKEGQLRSYALSAEGREVTLYRLFPRDVCLFSASCMMNSIQFDVTIQAEKDTTVWVFPPDVYKDLMGESAPLANFTNEIMATRFSEVMWLLDQVMWKSFDRRLAAFLLEESTIENTLRLTITHEAIANHLGTAREVVTRMLRYFQSEGMVALSRGVIQLADEAALSDLAEN